MGCEVFWNDCGGVVSVDDYGVIGVLLDYFAKSFSHVGFVDDDGVAFFVFALDEVFFDG